jgi:myosin heavy subunit
MAFQYRNSKGHDENGSQWTSYSDLFMGLSVVFLLLYVVASLRSGTTGLQQQIEKERLTMEVQDLQNQLKVYNSLKKEAEQTPEDEKLYQNLLSKLDLLKEEAKTESEKLKQQALENDEKEAALNQYQQLVRNMVNANMIAKTRIKKRDDIIVSKNQEIRENKKEITELVGTVEENERQLAANEQKIQEANRELDRRVKQLRGAYKAQKMTKKAFETQMAELQQSTQEVVQNLKAENKQVASALSQTSNELATTKNMLTQKDAQARNLVSTLEKTKGEFEGRLGKLKSDFEGQRAKEKAAFEAQLNAEKLSGEERARREAQFRAASDAKAQALAQQISGLTGKVKETEGQLAKALAEANARKAFAAEIKRGFARAGIKADVDPETGDVMLDFGDHYFDSGRSELKPEMVSILKKAFPIYAASILENPNVKAKVKNVEIVGFASPTYKGKLIDPNTLSPEDRKAVDFNLDLSYARARSIFQQIFDTNKMQFPHQKELIPLVKVTGRSFLSDSKNLRGIANQNRGQFCDKYDCKKAQRVIIKFGFDN